MNKIFRLILGIYPCLVQTLSRSCGIDNSPVNKVYEGQAEIETYPWLGILYYPRMNKRFTTAVVLVTRQVVLAAATEIDRLPKNDFRAHARVVLGHNCSGPHLTIRDYTYHPDFSSKTFSALSIIQLETDLSDLDLRPICPPPTYFNNPQFFAMVLSNECKESRIMIHKMVYVSPKDCKSFYRRSDLDVDSMWPTHTACARSMTGGRCLWRSGAILTIKTGNRWRLLGFGVYGPGCEAPSRFLDYGMYHKWVERSVTDIGKPTLTTMSDNHVVLRRMSGNIQRFGPCDQGETLKELYSDSEVITVPERQSGYFSYNISLYANVDYSCVTFKADYTTAHLKEKPKLRIQRWCAGSTDICYGFGLMSIHFRVSVEFQGHFMYKFRAYGQAAMLLDPTKVVQMLNSKMKNIKVINLLSVRARLKHKTYGPTIYLA